MKTILIIMGRYLPGYKDGGPVRSIKNLVDRLGSEYHFKILTTDRDHGDEMAYPDIKRSEWNSVGNAEVYYVKPGGFQAKLIKQFSSEADMIYVCGCFNDYARTTLALKKKKKISCRVVIASMGLFSPGAFRIKKWKKQIYMTGLKLAGYFHNIEWSATSEQEANYIRQMTYTQAVCHIAEDLPRTVEPISRNREKDSGELKVIFLSRISRKKNLLYAIDILSQVKGNIIFDIYGNKEDKNYWKECLTKLEQLPDYVSWQYCGEAEAARVVEIFSQYDVFLFPTMGENYGHVIFEAMAGGCIPMISDQTPWNFPQSMRRGRTLSLQNQTEWVQEIQSYVDMEKTDIEDCFGNVLQYALELSGQNNPDGYRKIFELE